MKTIQLPPDAYIYGDGQADCYCERGGLAITRLPMLRDDTKGWRLTHLKSGLIAATRVTLAEARKLLPALLAIEGADWTKGADSIHPAGIKALGEMVYEVRDRLVVRKGE